MYCSDHIDACKCLDKLVLHNECGLSVVRFALSLFACNVPSGVKKVVSHCVPKYSEISE